MDIESHIDQGKRIDIELGTTVLFQIEGLHGRVKSILVGMEPDAYSIFKLPRISIGLKHVLYKGNAMVVHYHHNGSIFSYEARILGTTTDPVGLLFLSMPKVVEEQSLRAARRVDCFIPCNLQVLEEECTGTIVDLSTAGCRVLFSISRDKVDRIMHEADIPVLIEAEIPDQAPLVLSGILRNTAEYHRAVRAGVKYQDLEPGALEAIQAVLTRNWEED